MSHLLFWVPHGSHNLNSLLSLLTSLLAFQAVFLPPFGINLTETREDMGDIRGWGPLSSACISGDFSMLFFLSVGIWAHKYQWYILENTSFFETEGKKMLHALLLLFFIKSSAWNVLIASTACRQPWGLHLCSLFSSSQPLLIKREASMKAWGVRPEIRKHCCKCAVLYTLMPVN